MRGLLGGIFSGGLVSVLALSTASIVSETPAGSTPPAPPLVDAPEVDAAPAATAQADEASVEPSDSGPSTPVGALTIEAPQTPALPEDEAAPQDPTAPPVVTTDPVQPRADTDPLDEPEVVAIEGAMTAPETPDAVDVPAQGDDPVFPNPQSVVPETPVTEADLTISTQPAAPTLVAEPEAPETDPAAVVDTAPAAPEDDAVFVIDLGADAAPQDAAPAQDPEADAVAVEDTEAPAEADAMVESADEEPQAPAAEDQTAEAAAEASEAPADVPTEAPTEASPEAESTEFALLEEPAVPQPGLQLQGGENSLLADRDTGVVIRRPGADDAENTSAPAVNALVDFAATVADTGGKPLMSVVLIDDGSMSAAAAALSGLPFPVTIAVDSSLAGAADLMASYRSNGFEVMTLVALPEGALPTDVEVSFQAVFNTLPEAIGLLDIGDGGLQADRDVTEQAMEILASQGRGYVTASKGLNMAGRAAEQAGVPAGVIYRDLDADDQDARVVRRFVDQAAFRARQESGVVLVGRVRPDTISALILWGTANQDDLVAVVPVSTVLTAQ